MLGRDGAEADFSAETLRAAQAWFDQSDRAQQDALLNAIMSGLPGAYDRFAVAELRDVLVPWHGFSASDLRANMKRFLQEIVPTAEELGIRLCVHPDDPPRPLLGLPRIVSSENDIAEIFEMYDSDSNGLTLCTGSLGANPQNDPVQIAKRFAHRVHFAHLRNVAKEADGSFQEAAHLDGDTDLPAAIDVLLSEEARRRKVGRADAQIPMRPDHGHALCSDLGRNTHPGYPLVGRLRGLAELRGVIAGLEHMRRNG
jgi:mannonate dehydratase